MHFVSHAKGQIRTQIEGYTGSDYLITTVGLSPNKIDVIEASYFCLLSAMLVTQINSYQLREDIECCSIQKTSYRCTKSALEPITVVYMQEMKDRHGSGKLPSVCTVQPFSLLYYDWWRNIGSAYHLNSQGSFYHGNPGIFKWCFPGPEKFQKMIKSEKLWK